MWMIWIPFVFLIQVTLSVVCPFYQSAQSSTCQYQTAFVRLVAVVVEFIFGNTRNIFHFRFQTHSTSTTDKIPNSVRPYVSWLLASTVLYWPCFCWIFINNRGRTNVGGISAFWKLPVEIGKSRKNRVVTFLFGQYRVEVREYDVSVCSFLALSIEIWILF